MTRQADQPAPPPTDQQLVRQYQTGQVAAFEQLVERYREELFHFLIRFVGSRPTAEDIFQEAFLQVHRAIDSFDTTRPFKPWLFTIAANKARDQLRRNKRSVAQLSAPVGDPQDEGPTFIDLMDIEVPGPDDRAQNQETRQLVREIVATMPEHLREVLLMAYFHQIPYRDIARDLKIPLGTVKSRLHAAVGTFARLWKERYEKE